LLSSEVTLAPRINSLRAFVIVNFLDYCFGEVTILLILGAFIASDLALRIVGEKKSDRGSSIMNF
jgi:hypothetical protein